MTRSARHHVTRFIALVTLFVVPTVLAHGGEEGSADAADLANQAIAFLQAEPPDAAEAGERIGDALSAEEAPDDIDLVLLQAADLALQQGATAETVALLNRALGQRSEPLGPIVTVTIGAGTFLAFAIAALAIGLGAYGLGRRARSDLQPASAAGTRHG